MANPNFGLPHSGQPVIPIPETDPRFNWEATETEYFVDQIYNMMLIQNPGWKPEGENGKGDAIGRNFIAFFTYGDPRFLEGIEDCWEKVERKGWLKRLLFGKYYYQGYRYPHRFPGEVGLSRDHTIYTLLAFKYAGYSDEFIKDFVKHLRYKISDFALFTPESWLWIHTLYGSKFYTWLFLTITTGVSWLSGTWNKLIYKLAPFEEESSQNDFIKVQNSMKPKRIQRYAKMLYPIYALHIHAWHLYLLPDSKLKRKAQKVALRICPKHNYVIQMLLGFKDMVDSEKVYDFKSMTGFRWSGVLESWINDRDINIITDPKRLEWNQQDVDYLRKLYSTDRCTDI